MRVSAKVQIILGFLCLTGVTVQSQQNGKPHIIFIVADDLGWNDVSFHGSDQIPTPNIDALAYNGVILNNHYVPYMCTPSRSALMTAKHPARLGMQHDVIHWPEPWGLPLSEKILPQYLKEAGYKTHAVGKWHLGFHKHEYTPTYRGFDSHFGFWNGLQDYYTHDVKSVIGEPMVGFDMRRNMNVAWDTRGHYSTDLFTEEAEKLIHQHNSSAPMFLYLAHSAPHSGNTDRLFQAPAEEIAKFSYIKDPERRIYAAMVSRMDEGVGRVIEALKYKQMLENSVVVFISDNGAPTQGLLHNRGSNYPLRGMKAAAFEGGIRGVAAIWSPLIKEPKRVSNQLMYVTDWMPTLFGIARIRCQFQNPIDGFDLWPSISRNIRSRRAGFLVNIDPIDQYLSLRQGRYKYIRGHNTKDIGWYGASGRPLQGHSKELSPPYDLDSILWSSTNLAMSTVWVTRTTSILESKDIERLRKSATVNCGISNDQMVPCDPEKSACLFDVVNDPCEKVNLAPKSPNMVAQFEAYLVNYQRSVMYPLNAKSDPKANPKLWNNTWVNWQDENPWQFSY